MFRYICIGSKMTIASINPSHHGKEVTKTRTRSTTMVITLIAVRIDRVVEIFTTFIL